MPTLRPHEILSTNGITLEDDRLIFTTVAGGRVSVGGIGGFRVASTPAPMPGQVPKYQADGTIQWANDQTATPGMAVQSNWAETDMTSAAFIQNKPTIPELTAQTLNDIIDTPASHFLSKVIDTGNTPNTLNLGLSNAAIERLVDTGGTAGQVYTRTATGHTWANPQTGMGGSSTFEGLTDTPASLGTAGQLPQVNSAADALEWVSYGVATRGGLRRTAGTGTVDFSIDMEIYDRLALLNSNDDMIISEGGIHYKTNLSTIGDWIAADIADGTTITESGGKLTAVGGGGGTPATPETLYDNTDPSDTALTRTGGGWTWANDLKFPLSRALVAADDDKIMVLELTFTSNRGSPPGTPITRSISLHISPRQFRVLPSNTATTGSTISAEFIHALGIRAREGDPTFGTAARNSIITRQRHTDGHDIFRFIMNTDGSTIALSNIRAKVMLLPLGGGGSGTGDNDYVDSIDASLSGQDLTITLGRTGTLVDLSDTVTLPSGGVSQVITRPEPTTAAAANFNSIYGGGAGATGQDYLSYKRIVANHTTRISVHNLNEVGFTVEKRGWASEAGLIQGNIAGGSARPVPDGIRGIMEYKAAGGEWRIWLITDGTGEWSDDTRSYDIKYVEVGVGGAVTEVGLAHDLVTDVGEWRSTDPESTSQPRFAIGKQYDIQIRRGGTSSDVVLHAGNELSRLADQTQLDSVEGELLALIDDLRHQPTPATWAETGNTDLIPNSKLPVLNVDRIVFFDDMGNLRAGTDDDWNTTLSLSEPFAWTGTQLQKLNATPVPKSADYTLVPEGSAIAVGRQWRGAFGTVLNVPSPMDGDVIWSTVANTYAYNDPDDGWQAVSAPNANIPHFVANQVFANQAAATAATEVTANGQIVLIQTGANPQAYLTSNFVAARNDYAWGNIYSAWSEIANTDVIPPAKLGTGTTSNMVFLRGDGQWAMPPGGGGTANPLAFTGFDTFTYDTSTRELIITVNQAGGGTDTTKEMLPEWILIDRVSTWARNNDMSRIPRSKAPAGGIFSLHTFALEHQEFQVGELAVAMDGGSAGLGQTIQLTGDPLFELEPGAIMRIDDEEFEFTGYVGGNMRNIIGGRGRSGTTIAPHAVGTAVFAQDLNREFIQLSFTSNDQLTLHSIPLEMPFVTKSGFTDGIANWALAGSTVNIPNTKFGGTPNGSRYLLDTGAWSDLPSFDTNTEPWALQSNPTTRIPVGKMGTGATSTAVFLRGDGTWADPAGLSVSDGDARYARLAVGNTFTNGPQTIDYDGMGLVLDARGYTGNDPAFDIILGTSGDQKAFQFKKGDDSFAWTSWEYNIGGSGKAGFELGPGGSDARDVNLYRDATNVIKTDDRMEAANGFRATLPLGQTTVIRARNTASSSNAADWFSLNTTAGGTNKPGLGFGNAGIGSEAAPDTILYRDAPNVWKTPDAMDIGSLRIDGTAMGASSGRWNTSTLGTGSATNDNFLRGDQTWTRPTFEGLSDTPNGYGTAAQYVRVNSSADGLEYADFPAILSEATVRGFISDWAETGNTDFIPTGKMGPGGGANRYLAWGATGANWLTLPSGGMYPGDDHVKDLIGASGSFLTTHGPIGLDYDTSTRMLEISTSARTEAQVNAQIEARRDIEWCNYTATITSTAITLALDGESNTAAPNDRLVGINYTTVLGNAHDDALPVFVSYNSLNSGNVEVFSGTGATRRNLTVGDLKRFGWGNVTYVFRRVTGNNWDLVDTPVRFSTSEDVNTLVEDWALKANTTTRVPVAKLGSGTASGSTYLRGDGTWAAVSGGGTGDDAFDWATVGNTDRIPADKMGSGQAITSNFLRGNRSWGAVLFTELSGTPSSYGSATQILQVNSAGTGLEFVDKPTGGSGASTFLALTDTPSAFGTSGQIPAVNSAGDGLEFIDAPSGGTGTGTIETLYDNTSGTALSRSAGAWSWANDLQFALNRALVTGDDDKVMVLEITFTSSRTTPSPATSVTRSISLTISPRQFRELASNGLTTGTTIPGSVEFIHAHGIRFRNGDPTFGTAARNSIITRQRHTDGHDVLRIILNTDSSSVAISDVFARVILLPTGGGSGGTDTNSFVTGGTFSLSGQQLSLQLTGNTGFTTVNIPAITLPAGSGTGDDAFDWATVGNTDLIPTAKLATGTADANSILYGNQTWGQRPSTWAQHGNTDRIDVAKLGSGTADDTKALYGDGSWGQRPSTWAQHDNNDRIPINKMTGYPTSISANVGSGNFNLILNRQDASQLTWSFAYPTVWDMAGSGGGLTAEQVRDTIAAFATEGDNMSIVHRDAANELVFSAAAPVEFTAALLIDSTGHAYALTPSQPGNSYDIGQVSGWATGTPGLLQGATWLNDRFYLLTQNPRVNGMYELNVRTLVTTQISGTFPSALQSVGGLAEHNDKLYTVTNIGSSPGIYEIDPNDVGSTSLVGGGGLPAGMTGAINDIFSFAGKLYVVMANRDLWDIDLTDTDGSTEVGTFGGSGTQLGPFIEIDGKSFLMDGGVLNEADLGAVTLTTVGSTGITNTLQAATHVRTGLTTGFVREGANLYYTDARVKDWLTGLSDYSDGRFLTGVSGTGDPVWEHADYDNLLDRPLLRVANVSSIPTPGSSNVGHRYQTNDGHQYLIESHTLGHVDRVVNYTAVPTVAVGTAGYRGAVYTLYDLPPASLEATNAYFMAQFNALNGGYAWYVRNSSGDWQPQHSYPGTGTFIGGYLDEARANPHVTAAGNVIAYGDGTVREIALYTVDSDFVAGTGGTTTYEVVPVDRDAGATSLSVSDWALTGNTDVIPTGKLGTGTADNTKVLYGDGTWKDAPSGGGTTTPHPFVVAESDGDLRDPTAADWNDSHSFSKVLGFDGHLFYVVNRMLSGAHGASASYSTINSGATFTVSGTTYTYKGSHQHDYNVSADINDFYFRWSTGFWRIFRMRGASDVHDYWENLDLRDILPTYIRDYSSSADALAHISAVGQYVIYPISGTYTLRRVTAYTAPSSGTISYDWERYDPFALDAYSNEVRGIIERESHTFIEPQTIDNDDDGTLLLLDAREYTGDDALLDIRVGTSGDRKAMQFFESDNSFAWASFEFDLGGINKPGFEFGPGGSSARDVVLYRDAANVWRTPDTFHAGAFNVDSTGQETTLDNLAAMGRHTDSTIEGDGTASDPLKVSVHDVTTALQERIRYYTSEALDFSGKGHTIGHVYNTGPYGIRLHRVIAYVDAPNSGGTYIARVLRLNSNNTVAERLANSNTRSLSSRGNHYFDFDDGTNIPTGTRIFVGISRTDEENATMRVGSEDSNSPFESYDDASVDFDRVGWAEYGASYPDVNDSTESHDTSGSSDVYGNIDIQYSRIFDHGNFVGDGNVDADHIDSDGATAGHALLADGSDGADWGVVARPGVANTFTAAQTIDFDGIGLVLDARTNTGGDPALDVITGASGDQKAVQFKKSDDSFAWASWEYNIGGSGKPGFELGPGGDDARDVNLYRESASVLRTDDTFQANALVLSTDLAITHGGTGASTASAARTNLGLGDLATQDEVTASDIDSGSATDGHVLTADGSGGVAWEAVSGGTSGITQTQADARYLQLSGGTLTGALTVEDDGVAMTARRTNSGTVFIVDGSDAGTSTLMQITTPTGGGKAFGSNRDGEGTDWVQFRYDAGGGGKPGLEIGLGSSGRDIELYREAANVLRTPDAMQVGELRVDSGGRANSRTQLGLQDLATIDSGISSATDGQVLTADGSGGAAWEDSAGGGSFDIHDDVGTSATISDSDRIIFSDEGTSGDPMRYTTAANLADYMQTEVSLNANRITSGTLSTARIPDIAASKIDSGSATDGQVLTADGSGDASWEDAPGLSFNTAVGLNLTLASGTPYVGTGFTGWSDKTVIFISVGEESSPTASVQLYAAGFLIFVADILNIPNTAAIGDAVVVSATNRNTREIVIQDPDEQNQYTRLRFGRTSASDPELLFSSETTSSAAYPFRAIAI